MNRSGMIAIPIPPKRSRTKDMPDVEHSMRYTDSILPTG